MVYVNPESNYLIRINLHKTDPKGFFKQNSRQVIFDEVQKYPEALSFIQILSDEVNEPGQFIISGSENLLLSEHVSQSLAGRAGLFTLLPLAYSELVAENIARPDTYSQIITGFYPRIYDMNLIVQDFYSEYLATYVERDIRALRNVGNLGTFQRFLQLLAGRTGQLLNLASLANDAGIDAKTAEAWLNILEATYIVFRLQPYYENFGKRVIKSPKIFFTDVGLLSYLLALNSANEVKSHYIRGSIFENLVITEIYKFFVNNGARARLYFWRDSNNNEVDVIVDKGLTKLALEIKSGESFASGYFDGLKYWQQLPASQQSSHGGTVIYDGDIEQKVGDFELTNWKSFMLSKTSALLG